MSRVAILNANYLMRRLAKTYDLPNPQHCMHEFVLSGRGLKQHGVKTLDVAKRLLDFGVHAPTVYFPLIVEEALMIEPTETETLDRLDHFAARMERIAAEAAEDPELLHQAPHTTPWAGSTRLARAASPGCAGASRRAETREAGGKGDLGLSAGCASQEARAAEPDAPPPGGRRRPGRVEWTVSPWREHPRAGGARGLAPRCCCGCWPPGCCPGSASQHAPGPGRARGAGAGHDPDAVPAWTARASARRALFAWDRRAWPEIRRARVSAAGLFVSPFARRSRLDRFRGPVPPVAAATRAAAAPLLEALRQEVARHGL